MAGYHIFFNFAYTIVFTETTDYTMSRITPGSDGREWANRVAMTI